MVASKTKEVEVVLPTFEIKEVEIMILAFAIKLKHVEEDEVMQKKA